MASGPSDRELLTSIATQVTERLFSGDSAVAAPLYRRAMVAAWDIAAASGGDLRRGLHIANDAAPARVIEVGVGVAQRQIEKGLRGLAVPAAPATPPLPVTAAGWTSKMARDLMARLGCLYDPDAVLATSGEATLLAPIVGAGSTRRFGSNVHAHLQRNYREAAANLGHEIVIERSMTPGNLDDETTVGVGLVRRPLASFAGQPNRYGTLNTVLTSMRNAPLRADLVDFGLHSAWEIKPTASVAAATRQITYLVQGFNCLKDKAEPPLTYGGWWPWEISSLYMEDVGDEVWVAFCWTHPTKLPGLILYDVGKVKKLRAKELTTFAGLVRLLRKQLEAERRRRKGPAPTTPVPDAVPEPVSTTVMDGVPPIVITCLAAFAVGVLAGFLVGGLVVLAAEAPVVVAGAAVGSAAAYLASGEGTAHAGQGRSSYPTPRPSPTAEPVSAPLPPSHDRLRYADIDIEGVTDPLKTAGELKALMQRTMEAAVADFDRAFAEATADVAR